MKTFFENGSNRNHDRRMCDAAVVQLVSARRNCTEGRERPSADRSTADASQRRRVTRRQPRRFASGQRMLETAVAPPRPGSTTTTITMATLMQAGATLPATITTAIPAATVSVANTLPDCTHDRRCSRATMAAGAREAALGRRALNWIAREDWPTRSRRPWPCLWQRCLTADHQGKLPCS
jgi:hypothetical protein